MLYVTAVNVVNEPQVNGFAALKISLTDNRLCYYALSPVKVCCSVEHCVTMVTH